MLPDTVGQNDPGELEAGWPLQGIPQAHPKGRGKIHSQSPLHDLWSAGTDKFTSKKKIKQKTYYTKMLHKFTYVLARTEVGIKIKFFTIREQIRFREKK